MIAAEAPVAGGMPTSVEQSASKVYRLVTGTYKIIQLEHADAYASTIKLFQALPDSVERLKVCQNAGHLRCLVRMGPLEGSAFAVNDGSSLWTAAHMFNQYIEKSLEWHEFLIAQKESSSLRDWDFLSLALPYAGARDLAPRIIPALPLEMQLVDGFGNVVFDTFSGSGTDDSAKVSALFSAATAGGAFTGLASDAIRLKLSKKMKQVLEFAQEPDPVGSAIWIAGYPGERPQGAADSIEPYVSSGASISLTELPKLDISHDNLPFLRSQVQDVIIMNAWGAQGMSGGPVLNERGQVVGAFQGLIRGNSNPRKVVLTIAVGIDQFSFIDSYYQSFKSGL